MKTVRIRKINKLVPIVCSILSIILSICCLCNRLPILGYAYAENNRNDLSVGTYTGYAATDYELYGDSISFDDWLHNETTLTHYTDAAPTMTFLVHGQNSAASYWSNNAGKPVLIYDDESLIEILRNRAQGADVYYAQSTFEYGFLSNESDPEAYKYIDNNKEISSYNIINGEDYRKLNPSFNSSLNNNCYYNRNIVTKKGFDLFTLKLNDAENDYDDLANCKNNKLKVNNKHIVVVFGATPIGTEGYHYVVNNELHYIIDNLSYDYKVQTGMIPKINLMGHSRGGVTCLNHVAGYQYNNDGQTIYDHAFNVDNIFTFGSPLPGRYGLPELKAKLEGTYTPSSDEVLDKAVDLLGSVMTKMDLGAFIGNLFDCNSTKDLANEEVGNHIKANWAAAIRKNQSIHLYAMGSDMRPSFLAGLIERTNNIDTISILLTICEKMFDITIPICETILSFSAVGIAGACFMPAPLDVIVFTGSAITFIASAGLDIYLSLGKSSLNEALDIQKQYESLKKQLELDTNNEELKKETNQAGKDLIASARQPISYLTNIVDIISEALDMFMDSDGVLSDVYNILGDVLVDTKTQLGYSLDNSYGNITPYLKTYTSFKLDNGTRLDNFDVDKIATEMPEVPHNLELRDVDFIAYAVRNATLAEPTTIYNTSVLADNTLRINGVDLTDQSEQIHSLDISQGILGIQITEIADDSFSQCIELKHIILPQELESYGKRVFVGTALDKIEVKQFRGTNNFVSGKDNAINLNNIEVRNNVLYGVSTLDNGNKTKMLQIPMLSESLLISDSIVEIEDYACYGSTIESVSGGDGLRKIGKFAFARTPFYKNKKGIVTVGKFVVGYSGNKTELTADDFSDVSYIADGAFAFDCDDSLSLKKVELGANIKDIGEGAFENNSVITDIDFSKTKVSVIRQRAFYNSINLKNVALPIGLTAIMSEAFSGSAISSLTIREQVNAIGSNCFADCDNLNELNILGFYPPSLGESVFVGCDTLVINIPNAALSRYSETINWRDFSDKFRSKQFTITLDTTGGENCGDLIKFYYDPLNDLPMPNRNGYTFLCWKDAAGNIYRSSDIWNNFSDGTLYANWQPIVYSIIYNNVDGLVNDNALTYTIEQTIKLDKVKKPHNTFIGWYMNSDFNGEAITEIQDGNWGTIYLYARYSPKTTLVYDSDNKNIVDGANNVQYGLPFKLIVPKKESYVFDGWYYNNIRLTDKNGYSITNWAFAEDSIVLSEKWHSESYVVTINNNGELLFVGQSGINDNTTSVLYGAQYTSSDKITEQFVNQGLSHLEGHIFKGLFDNSGQAISWDTTVPDFGDDSDEYAIIPKWEKEIYTVKFKDAIQSYAFDEEVVYPNILKTGYSLVCWKIKSIENCNTSIYKVGSVFDFYTMPDLDPNFEGTAKIILEPEWRANNYVVSFDSNGGSYCDAILVTYDEVLNRAVGTPTRTGYTFNGWYKDNLAIFNSKGMMNAKWTIPGNTTLKAKWTPIIYHITYNTDGGNLSGNYKTTYTIEDEVVLPTPTKYMYRFKGWYKNNVAITKISKGTIGDITLVANWIGTIKEINTTSQYSTINETFSDDVTIVKLSNASTTNKYVFTVSNSVTELTLIGSSKVFNMYINFDSRTNAITLRFINITINAPVGYNAINFSTISIKIRIEIDGAVTITGGNGATPVNTGIAGNSGKSGIYAFKANIEFIQKNSGTLTIKGGNGSSGTNGIAGINGLKGSDGKNVSSTGGNAHSGSKGDDGGNGQNGGNGGDGGYAIVALSCNQPSFVSACGGNAGKGGDGGDGGNGGKGGNGGSDDDFWTNGNPGNGGKGGNAGNGGDGGYGGNGGYGYKINGSTSGEQGSSACGGSGGSAGTPGSGGAGGSAGTIGKDGKSGSKGDTGVAGVDRSSVIGR